MSEDQMINTIRALWQADNLDPHVETFPPGWRGHAHILMADIATTLDLTPEQIQQLVDHLGDLLGDWSSTYPDPSLLIYFLALKLFRPEHFADYLKTATLPQDDAYNINRETFTLIHAIHEALTSSANPMRVRDRMREVDELIDDFFFEHDIRFITPFDGRSTEQIYCMTGHIEELLKALAPEQAT